MPLAIRQWSHQLLYFCVFQLHTKINPFPWEGEKRMLERKIYLESKFAPSSFFIWWCSTDRWFPLSNDNKNQGRKKVSWSRWTFFRASLISLLFTLQIVRFSKSLHFLNCHQNLHLVSSAPGRGMSWLIFIYLACLQLIMMSLQGCKSSGGVLFMEPVECFHEKYALILTTEVGHSPICFHCIWVLLLQWSYIYYWHLQRNYAYCRSLRSSLRVFLNDVLTKFKFLTREEHNCICSH